MFYIAPWVSGRQDGASARPLAQPNLGPFHRLASGADHWTHKRGGESRPVGGGRPHPGAPTQAPEEWPASVPGLPSDHGARLGKPGSRAELVSCSANRAPTNVWICLKNKAIPPAEPLQNLFCTTLGLSQGNLESLASPCSAIISRISALTASESISKRRLKNLLTSPWGPAAN